MDNNLVMALSCGAVSATCSLISAYVGYKIGKKKEHRRMRKEMLEDRARIREEMGYNEEYSNIPIDAAETIERSLCDDEEMTTEQKPFRYKALVTVKDDRIKIEDYYLYAKSDSRMVSLAEFNRDGKYVDQFLMNSKIIEAICSNLRHDMEKIEDDSVFSAQYEALCKEEEYDNAFVLIIDLGFESLNVISNLDAFECLSMISRKDLKKRRRENRAIEIHNEFLAETNELVEQANETIERLEKVEKKLILLNNLIKHFNDPDFPRLRDYIEPKEVVEESEEEIIAPEIIVPEDNEEEVEDTTENAILDPNILVELQSNMGRRKRPTLLEELKNRLFGHSR